MAKSFSDFYTDNDFVRVTHLVNYGNGGLGFAGFANALANAKFAYMKDTENGTVQSVIFSKLMTECVVTPYSKELVKNPPLSGMYNSKDVVESIKDILVTKHPEYQNILLTYSIYDPDRNVTIKTCKGLYDSFVNFAGRPLTALVQASSKLEKIARREGLTTMTESFIDRIYTDDLS